MAKKYTDLQKAFLEHLDGEAKGKVRLAMDMAGYSKSTPPSDVINALHDEILDIARSKLTGGSVRAVEEMVNLLDNPASLSSRTTIAVVKEILDRVGIVKQEQLNITNETGGVVILPNKRPEIEED